MAEKEQGAEQKPESTGLPDGTASQPQTPGTLTEPEAGAAGSKALAAALKGSFAVLKVVILLIIAFCVFNAFFHVAPQEVKFKLRFGRVVPSRGEWALKPGKSHIRWPWEEVYTASTEEKVLPVETEFWTEYYEAAKQAQRKTSLRVQDDGYLITGDVNIVHMRLRARYRVRTDAKGALSFLFGVAKPEEVLKRMLLASAVKVVGSVKVMDVLQGQDVFGRITAELVARVRAFEEKAGIPLGIEVLTVEAEAAGEGAKNPTEPQAVSASFTEAQNASSLRAQLVDEGKLEAISIAGDATANVQEIKAEAAGLMERTVQAAAADAKAMETLLPLYRKSFAEANVMREALFLNALHDMLNAAQAVFVVYDNPNREMRYQITAEPPPAKEKESTESKTGTK